MKLPAWIRRRRREYDKAWRAEFRREMEAIVRPQLQAIEDDFRRRAARRRVR